VYWGFFNEYYGYDNKDGKKYKVNAKITGPLLKNGTLDSSLTEAWNMSPFMVAAFYALDRMAGIYMASAYHLPEADSALSNLILGFNRLFTATMEEMLLSQAIIYSTPVLNYFSDVKEVSSSYKGTTSGEGVFSSYKISNPGVFSDLDAAETTVISEDTLHFETDLGHDLTWFNVELP
jgi:hypothetical protein